MRIFKWPWDSVAIVPTTLQRIEFVADQITRERVGVEVSGVAVYRIAEPELAFRVLNFSYGEAASEKLGATLREMFVGASRRLVANLSLDECLSRRKETIASFLMDEIAPVVSGHGSPDDTTVQGWGVVIDTIEIQQVRIQSSQVFAHLQAPYRSEIAARAELAEIERRRQVTEHQAAAAERASELDRERTLRQIAIVEEHRRVQAASEVAMLAADATRVEALHRAAELEAEHVRVIAQQQQAAELELQRARQAVTLELRLRDAEARDRESQLDAEHQRRAAELEQLLAETRNTRALVQALPQIAGALASKVDTMNYTHVGTDGTGPLDAVPSALAQLLAFAKSFGVTVRE
jgi:flotillin